MMDGRADGRTDGWTDKWRHTAFTCCLLHNKKDNQPSPLTMTCSLLALLLFCSFSLAKRTRRRYRLPSLGRYLRYHILCQYPLSLPPCAFAPSSMVCLALICIGSWLHACLLTLSAVPPRPPLGVGLPACMYVCRLPSRLSGWIRPSADGGWTSEPLTAWWWWSDGWMDGWMDGVAHV